MSLAAACMIFTMFQGQVCLWQPGQSQPIALSPQGDAVSYSPLQVTADGRRVYYNVNHNLWEVATTRPSKPRQLTRKGYAKTIPGEDYAETHECDVPRLSPDGRMLAYRWTPADTPELWVLNLQTGDDRKLATGVELGPETWTPDGSAVVFGRERSLWQISPDGTGLEQLTHFPPGEVWSDGQASFSRTGTLAFTRGNDVWLKRAGRPEEQLTRQGNVQWPTWSPDGLRLAAVVNDADPDTGEQWDEIILLAPGQEPRVLVSTRGKDAVEYSAADVVGWLSSDEVLILRTIGDAPPKLWAVNTETRQAKMVLKLRDGDETPALWVPVREGEG